MPAMLFNVPLVPWVRNTIAKMEANGRDDSHTWGRYWLLTYLELGGTSEASGTKGCPLAAAYGLWQLGRISQTRHAFLELPLRGINDQFGKNATYAVLAVALLESSLAPNDTAHLWEEVRRLYVQNLQQEPARSEQGAVKVARILFIEGQLVTGKSS